MKSSNEAWNRLVDTARRAEDPREVAAPYGFATRVTALAFAGQRPTGLGFHHVALRAMGLSCLLAVAAVATNYTRVVHFLAGSPSAPAATAGAVNSATPDDPMTDLVDLATS
jgi:hypothetical protein